MPTSNSLTILHQDFFPQNIVFNGSPGAAECDDTYPHIPWRVYIVDYEFAQQLEHGPGRRGAVERPDTIWPRPREGATRFDPTRTRGTCSGSARAARPTTRSLLDPEL